jgi:cell volume regulation protein A
VPDTTAFAQLLLVMSLVATAAVLSNRTGALARVPAPLFFLAVGVVVLSVLVQGSLVPAMTGWLRLPMRVVQPQPWASGVRLADEPTDVLRVKVGPGSAAIGRSIRELGEAASDPEELWVHLVVRDGKLLSTRGDTTLEAGDELVLSANPTSHRQIERQVAGPSPSR